MAADHLRRLFDRFLVGLVCSGENDRPRIRELVRDKLTEIFDIELCLGTVKYRHRGIELTVSRFIRYVFDRIHDIGELADPRWFDQNPLRRVFGHHFLE